MDETKTAMGRRLLKSRILHPLRNEELINHRLNMVESLYHSQEKLKVFRDLLSKMPDLERQCSRLAMDKAHGKDMLAVKNALVYFEQIEEEAAKFNNLRFESQEAFIDDDDKKKLKDLKELLEKGIAEDPSITLSEGGLIREGFNAELDRLMELKDSGRKLLEDYLEEERQETGISALKIKYNRLIGYYFEVTNVNLSKVPKRFIRRQGIAGGERFSTERLAALESEINGASDKIIELEKKLFLEIRGAAKQKLKELKAAGKRIAELDTAQSLARAATVHGWNKPQIDAQNRSFILEGRHPVVEAHLSRGEFIPNDLALDARDSGASEEAGFSFALITGPNMAGKSTYLRQAALINIMAQSGSFIPASEAKLGLVDRIYCRVGAQDNLARGESTFLVEMNETAYILHTASQESLVIMDEVGRGTGTEDGLSIAWAVCEELLENIKCRTLFATHYHELSRIVHPRLVNHSMDVTETGGRIIFLRKLKNGPAEQSYGLHVAALAGLPRRVIDRAEQMMNLISEEKQKKPVSLFVIEDGKNKGISFEKKQAEIVKELKNTDINSLTPLDALNLLQKWKHKFLNDKKANNDENPLLFD
jgi:DNA mismatch repair protein MutS